MLKIIPLPRWWTSDLNPGGLTLAFMFLTTLPIQQREGVERFGIWEVFRRCIHSAFVLQGATELH